MKTVKLICSDKSCSKLHGCLQFMRWGSQFHYCGICIEKSLCLLKHPEVHAEINNTFRCIDCINPPKRDPQKDIDAEKFYEDNQASLAWKKIAERFVEEHPKTDPYKPA